MWHFKNKYPNQFWADPQAFFTDGSLVNRGADFGLMPSIFEPGGIV
jgi:glycogen synthase